MITFKGLCLSYRELEVCVHPLVEIFCVYNSFVVFIHGLAKLMNGYAVGSCRHVPPRDWS